MTATVIDAEHLCDTCRDRGNFPACLPFDVEFENDNIIYCPDYNRED